MLLENKSQENVISMFIELRQNALKELLNEDISVHNVVRIQIINLMNCLICTILLIRSCFIGMHLSINNEINNVLFHIYKMLYIYHL